MTEEVCSDFRDVEDYGLRTHNRGSVMANMLEDTQLPNGNFNPKSLSIIMKYLSRIPVEERKDAIASMSKIVVGRGLNSV